MLSRTLSSQWCTIRRSRHHSIQCRNNVLLSKEKFIVNSTGLLSSMQQQIDRRHRPFGGIGTTAYFFVLPQSNHLLSAVQQLGENNDDNNFHNKKRITNQHLLTQVRHKRKSGLKAFTTPRPPTRKQKKKYYKRQRKLHHEQVTKHSSPGSIAGPIRQELEEERQFLLEYAKGEIPKLSQEEKEGYGYADAMIDDLFGNNTSEGVLSSPTPQPVYLGHYYRANLANVSNVMQEYLAYHNNDNHNKNQHSSITNAVAPSLPTDEQLSNLIRSYRDHNKKKQQQQQHTAKNNGVGIAPILKLLLLKLKIPSNALGPKSYSSLLTCASNPYEARRIMKLMSDNHCPPDKYSYGILIDIYAKKGDFRACNDVMEEMVLNAAIQPTLPAYTSLLAACYKACISGSTPPSIKAEAGNLAWTKWKEMFSTSSVHPDAMAYGALIRIFAARGYAERAINLIQEMKVMDVKPTTLIFTSALKAVARSHNNALRFNNGSSKKNKRREWIASHHGAMAREVVILAEQAEVEQDDGFVAALMLCAAAQGDVASAKAVLLASEVRRMKDLRSIGGEDHLRRLRGEDAVLVEDEDDDGLLLSTEQGGVLNDEVPLLSSSSSPSSSPSSSSSSLSTQPKDEQNSIPANIKDNRHITPQERIYGKDTRKLSALLLACSKASESRGLGNMWEGKDNLGFLDETSLRLIRARSKPQYRDPYIPGVSGVDVGLGSTTWEGDLSEKEVVNGKKWTSKTVRARGQARGKQDLDVGHTMDDLPEHFYQMFENHPKFVDQNDDFVGVGGEENLALTDGGKHIDGRKNTTRDLQGTYNDDDDVHEKKSNRDEDEDELIDLDEFFMNDLGSNNEFSDFFDDTTASNTLDNDSEAKMVNKAIASGHINENDNDDDGGVEYYFDDDIMRWKTRPKKTLEVGKEEENFDLSQLETTEESKIIEKDNDNEEEEIEFYFDDDTMQWKTRGKTIGASDDFDDKNRRKSTQDENDDFMKQIQEEFGNVEIDNVSTFQPQDNQDIDNKSNIPDFEDFFAELKKELEGENGIDIDKDNALAMYELMLQEHSPNDVDSTTSKKDDNEDDFMHNHSDQFSDFYARLEEEDIQSIGKNEDCADGSDSAKGTQDEPCNSILGSGAGQDFVSESADRFTKHFTAMDISGKDGNNTQLLEAKERDWMGHTIVGTHTADETSLTPDLPGKFTESGDVSDFAGNTLFQDQSQSVYPAESDNLNETEELEIFLPGLPKQRIEKIRRTFSSTLGYPSMLRLIPVLRENMPDYISPAWLKRKNLENAYFVMEKAKADDLVDIHVLNGMLQVEASAGRLGKALSFYDSFGDFGVKPNEYSDRLVIQMLLKNNRVSHALSFKGEVESKGRSVDLLSYGSLVEHYGKHDQLGSALMILKECIAVHGSPPGEKSLKQFRQICRRRGLTDEIGLEEYIGEDPIEWLRHGEANLKREYSYRGRRNLDRTRNASLRV